MGFNEQISDERLVDKEGLTLADAIKLRLIAQSWYEI